jgi:hypothetical protein
MTVYHNPVVVVPETIYVSKETYNTIRSFVESSLRTKYSFNVGVCKNNIAIFEKKGKWRLIIAPKKVVLCYNRTSVRINFNTCIEIDLDGYISCMHESELKKYNIMPDVSVPYAKPISLYDLISKVLVYYEAGQDCW